MTTEALTKIGLGGLHTKSGAMVSFLADFEKAASKEKGYTEALISCTKLCNNKWYSLTPRSRRFLVELFLGVPESDDKVEAKRYPAVMVTGDILTAPLEVLVRDRDSGDMGGGRSRFSMCQEFFRNSLIQEQDFCVGQVLERAFLWSLACMSSNDSKLTFGTTSFLFECTLVATGRIMTRNGDFSPRDVFKLSSGTLYHADESASAGTHKGVVLKLDAQVQSL